MREKELSLRTFADEIAALGWEIYDFGGGNIVMPHPLDSTKAIAAFYAPPTKGPVKYFCFEMVDDNSVREAISQLKLADEMQQPN